jgi:hypothetical protein
METQVAPVAAPASLWCQLLTRCARNPEPPRLQLQSPAPASARCDLLPRRYRTRPGVEDECLSVSFSLFRVKHFPLSCNLNAQ